MTGSRWRLAVAGATVVVSAASGILVNLVTDKWNVTLGVALGVLVVVGVLLQIAL
jgi:low affinity Fe/Cu permease